MKKTLIPMILVAATLLTGCNAADTNASYETFVGETANEEVTETNDVSSPEQVVETTIAPVVSQDETTPEESAIDTEPEATKEDSVITPNSDAVDVNFSSDLNSQLDSYPAYKEIVLTIKDAVVSNSQSLDTLNTSIAHFVEVCPERYPEEAILVSLYDINSDGTPELFFSRYTADYKGILILSMYTLNNGSLANVFHCESYESFAYSSGIGLVHTDDSQIVDTLVLNGSFLDVTSSHVLDESYSFTMDAIPGPTAWLSNIH